MSSTPDLPSDAEVTSRLADLEGRWGAMRRQIKEEGLDEVHGLMHYQAPLFVIVEALGVSEEEARKKCARVLEILEIHIPPEFK